MLIGEEPEMRPPPVLAVVMPAREAIVRTPQQASGDERRNPDVEMVGSCLLAGSGGDAHLVGGAHESTRTGTEAASGVEEPMRTAAEGADTRRGLHRSAELHMTTKRETAHHVLDNILMMMCRLSRQLCSKLKMQRMQQILT